jgi:hypothetical protein
MAGTGLVPMRRSKRENRHRLSKDSQIGLAWYSRETWEKLRAIADDGEKLDNSFEEWERGALQAIRELASVGRRVLKVPIDVEAYVAWCRERRCRLDSASRAEYVTERLKTEIARVSAS